MPPSPERSTWNEELGLHLLHRHGDVSAALRSPSFGRDGRGWAVETNRQQAPTWHRYVGSSFMELDGEEHLWSRRAVAPLFSAPALRALAPVVERLVDQCLPDVGLMDVVEALARPLPVLTMAHLLRLPTDAAEELALLSDQVVAPFEPSASAAVWEQAEEAAGRMVEMLTGSTDDVATAILIFNAGHEATTHAIANTIYALAQHPDQWRSIRNGETPTAVAVDELLRFDSPLGLFHRWVHEPVQLAGRTWSPGDKIGLLLAEANHDPEVFDNPELLDFDRPRLKMHVAFGGGAHRCMGAPLARIELASVLDAMARRFETFEVVSSRRAPGLVFRGFEELTVRVA